VKVLRKENMEQEARFPEEGEEPEKVKSDVMSMEKQGTSLGNVPREIKKEEEKNTLLKHISMWKKKQ
jgi:hypothetical protein